MLPASRACAELEEEAAGAVASTQTACLDFLEDFCLLPDELLECLRARFSFLFVVVDDDVDVDNAGGAAAEAAVVAVESAPWRDDDDDADFC